MPSIVNIAAYRFVAIDRLEERRIELLTLCREQDLCGTILLSPEGINLFAAGTQAGIDSFRDHLGADTLFQNMDYKISYSEHKPFKRMKVKLKREIITFNQPGIDPANNPAPSVTPRELKAWLDRGESIILLDTRNDYETRLGKFVGAVDPNITHFRQFPQALRDHPIKNTAQKIVAYCTGGIRCEKAAPWLVQQGFNNVYQLEGGILRYLEECGNAHFEGDCFVFDERVALDAQLQATYDPLCAQCQHPVQPEANQACACTT